MMQINFELKIYFLIKNKNFNQKNFLKMSGHHAAEVDELLVVLLERMRSERLEREESEESDIEDDWEEQYIHYHEIMRQDHEDDWEEEFIHYHEDDTPLHDEMMRSQDEPLTAEPANSDPLDDCPDDGVAQG